MYALALATYLVSLMLVFVYKVKTTLFLFQLYVSLKLTKWSNSMPLVHIPQNLNVNALFYVTLNVQRLTKLKKNS